METRARALSVLAALFAGAILFLVLARPARDLFVERTARLPQPPSEVLSPDVGRLVLGEGSERRSADPGGAVAASTGEQRTVRVTKYGQPVEGALVVAFRDEADLSGDGASSTADAPLEERFLRGSASTARTDADGRARLQVSDERTWRCFAVAPGAVTEPGSVEVDVGEAAKADAIPVALVDVACLELLFDAPGASGVPALEDPRAAFRVFLREGRGYRTATVESGVERVMYALAGLGAPRDTGSRPLVRHVFLRDDRADEGLVVGIRGAPPGFEPLDAVVRVPLLREGIARETVRVRTGVTFGELRLVFNRPDALGLFASDLRSKLRLRSTGPGDERYELHASRAARLRQAQGALTLDVPTGEYALSLGRPGMLFEANGGLPVRVPPASRVEVHWEIPLLSEVVLSGLEELPEKVGGVFVFEADGGGDEVHSLEGEDLRIAWLPDGGGRVLVYPYAGRGAWAFVEEPHEVVATFHGELPSWEVLEEFLVSGEVRHETANRAEVARLVDAITVRAPDAGAGAVLRPVRVAEYRR